MYKKFLELLLKHKKTVYQVSKETGIPNSTFSDWKTGRSNPKTDKLMILSKYFEVTVEYFFDDTKNKVQ